MKTKGHLLQIGLLWAAMLPAAVQAQFTFTTNNDGSLNINQYTGAGGVVVIPGTTNGLPVTSIGTNAFQLCFTLTSVTIPDSVTVIRDSAFFDCYNLTNATIGTNVTSMEGYAFGNCMSLTGVTIPKGVTNIGVYAFGDCGLTNLTIPDSVTSIGVSAFYDCEKLANVTIGTNVTSIGSSTFYFCTNLAYATIPNSVTNIGAGAFSYCRLINVTIGARVNSIGDYAFYSCSSLTGIYFQGNAPSLGSAAFAGDFSATVYYLPGTSGWSSPFGGRPAVMLNPPNPAGSLKVTLSPGGAITSGAQWQVDGGVTQPSGAIVSGLSVGSHTVSFSTANGWVTPTSQSVVVSANSTTTASGIYNLALTYITNNGAITITGYTVPGPSGAIVLPGTINGLPVTSIGNNAFQNLTNLTSVTIPNSVTNIGNGAFSNCGLLTGIYLQGNAPSLGSTVFAGDNNATVYYLPGTSGWSSTFGGRPAVMLNPPSPAGSLKVTISPTAAVTAGARWQVDGGLVQPSGATVSGLSVGTHTLTFNPLNGWAMPASQSVTVSANSTATVNVIYGQLTYSTYYGTIFVIHYSGNGGAMILPGSINGLPVTRILSDAFKSWTLASVTIPSSITNISAGAFNQCSLGAIIVDTNNPAYSSSAGVLFNKSQTILVAYPGGVAGSYAIPQSVISIANQAFGGCAHLTGVTFDTNVTTIGQGAFANCHNLTNVTLGTNVTSIGNDAFSQCGMTSVTIPGSVTTIGDDAFGFCGSLVAIMVDPANSFYCSINGVLFNKDQTTLVQFPAGVGGSYTIPQSVTNIESSAFGGCASLTSVTIPDSVTVIGGGAFGSCTGLTSITIPDSVTVIGGGAFGSCSGLTNVTIDANVTSIEDSTFSGCSGLTSITIPDSVTIIRSYAFFGCSGLTNIVIGTNVTSIADFAFFACSGLTSITLPDSVIEIGDGTFYSCTSLTSVTLSAHLATIFGIVCPNCPSLTAIYFRGDAPNIVPYGYSPYALAYSSYGTVSDATVYYLPWTMGWPTPGELFGGLTTALWLPQVQTSDATFGVVSNQFGFNITWASDTVVVVEACTDLANPVWTPVGTNALTGGSSYFSDSQWRNYPSRFYRLRSP